MTEIYDEYFDYLKYFAEQNGIPPRMTEISTHFRVDIKTARYMIDALLNWGWIRPDRSIVPPDERNA